MQPNHEDPSKAAFHGYVRNETHDSFERYMTELGLTSASALVALLLVRELALKRLTSAGWQSGTEPRTSKITAYVPAPQAAAFREHAAALGRSVSECVAELVEREVAECWLQFALGLDIQEQPS